MTLERLTQHYELREKLNRDRATLQSLRDKAQPGAQSITGMPRGSGVSDMVGALAVEIVYLEQQIEALEERVHEDEKELSVFFDGIGDHTLMLMFRLRFMYCLQWKEVADIVGCYNTEDSVKAACYRYLAKL